MNAIVALRDDLLQEHAILGMRGCLSVAELRKARNDHTITWTKGKRGQAWYRLSDVDAYIATYKEKKCGALAREPSLKSEAIGSPECRDGDACTISGLTPELERHAADRLAQQI